MKVYGIWSITHTISVQCDSHSTSDGYSSKHRARSTPATSWGLRDLSGRGKMPAFLIFSLPHSTQRQNCNWVQLRLKCSWQVQSSVTHSSLHSKSQVLPQEYQANNTRALIILVSSHLLRRVCTRGTPSWEN